MEARKSITLELLLVVAVILNVVTWFHARFEKARWINVPPVPKIQTAGGFALGDSQFAYRTIGITLQNLGDTGGRSTAMDDYNYNDLVKWFYLADRLDPNSHFVPFLAAYYFGAARKPESLNPLLDYLAAVGQRPGGERWRWLGQAVYIARWQMQDLDKALELANILANLNQPDLPLWTRQMPAFILNARGDKSEAADLLLEMLKDNAENIHPNEVNYTRDYICTRILEEEKAKNMPLCQNIP